MLGVSKYLSMLEPSGRCTDAEGRSLLQKLCPLLEALGKATKHPGLLQEHAIDNLGKFLNASNGEPYRRKLEEASGTLKVCLRRRAHEILFVNASEKLPDAMRKQCVAIRGTNEVARRLNPSERGMAELVVDYGDGALFSVRQQPNQRVMMVLFTSVEKRRKVLTATLSEEDGEAMEKLFDGAGRGLRAALPTESLAASLVNYKGRTYWTLPFWYAELLSQAAQDVFRLHALASASSPAVSRLLFIDHATVHRIEGKGVDPNNAKSVIKLIWHKASGGCLGHLHNKVSEPQFRRIEVHFEVCGAPLTSGKCARHWSAGGDEACSQSSTFPGLCAHAFKVELLCTHEVVPGKPPSGLRVSLSHLLREGNTDEAPLRRPLVDLTCCGLRLTQTPNAAALKDLKADAEQVFGELTRLRKEQGRTSNDLENRDEAAVWLLRRGGVNLGPDGKFKGARIQPEFQKLAPTHGHLFRKTTAK